MKYMVKRRIAWTIAITLSISSTVSGFAILWGWIGVGIALSTMGTFGLIGCLAYLAADEL